MAKQATKSKIIIRGTMSCNAVQAYGNPNSYMAQHMRKKRSGAAMRRKVKGRTMEEAMEGVKRRVIERLVKLGILSAYNRQGLPRKSYSRAEKADAVQHINDNIAMTLDRYVVKVLDHHRVWSTWSRTCHTSSMGGHLRFLRLKSELRSSVCSTL